MPDNNTSQDVQPQPEQKDAELKPVVPTLQPNPPNPADTETISTQQVEKDVQNLKDRLKAAEKWMIGLTAAIAVFALCQVGAALLQWNAMGGQLREMKGAGQQTDNLLCLYRQQLAEMQRQSIDTHGFAVASADQALAVTQSQSAHFELQKQQAIVELKKPITIPFDIINNGHSRARDVEIKMVAIFLPRSADPTFSYPLKSVSHIEGREWDVGVTLSNTFLKKGFSVAVHTTEGEELIADERMVSDYKDGQKDVLSYGTISYRDIFGVKHWLHFCGVSENFNEGNITNNGHPKCSDYNQTDSNSLISKPVQVAVPYIAVPETPCPLPSQSKPN